MKQGETLAGIAEPTLVLQIAARAQPLSTPFCSRLPAEPFVSNAA
jgi:hypothetical protein